MEGWSFSVKTSHLSEFKPSCTLLPTALVPAFGAAPAATAATRDTVPGGREEGRDPVGICGVELCPAAQQQVADRRVAAPRLGRRCRCWSLNHMVRPFTGLKGEFSSKGGLVVLPVDYDILRHILSVNISH